MTKIIVDETPKDPEDCPFVDIGWDKVKYRCRLKPIHSKCLLTLDEECDKLAEMGGVE